MSELKIFFITSETNQPSVLCLCNDRHGGNPCWVPGGCLSSWKHQKEVNDGWEICRQTLSITQSTVSCHGHNVPPPSSYPVLSTGLMWLGDTVIKNTHNCTALKVIRGAWRGRSSYITEGLGKGLNPSYMMMICTWQTFLTHQLSPCRKGHGWEREEKKW